MRFREVFVYRSLAICVLLSILVGSYSQSTWECDADSPYPYPELERYQVEIGDEICIPVIIDNFTDVNIFNFFIYFDSRYLRPTSTNTSMSGLANFTNSNIDYSPSAGPDFLRIIWSSSDALPVSLPSGTVLFEACFEALGPPGVVSPFLITSLNDQIPLFAIQDPDITVPAEERNPCTFQDNTLIRILPQPSAGPQLFLNSSCGSLGGNDSGVAEFSIFNGTVPYTVWNTDGENFALNDTDSTFILNNLPQGNYSYFIIDDTGLMSDTVTFTIDNQIPISLLTNARAPVCADGSNGFIQITPSGGIPFPNNFYRYEWSNGVQGIGEDQIVNLDTGTYLVSIFDSTGCRKDTIFDLSREALEIQVDRIDDAFCSGRDNGRVFISGIGGTPFAGGGYEFEIDGVTDAGITYSNSDFSPDSAHIFQGIPAGRYVVSVLDSFVARDLCAPILTDTIEIGYSRQYTAEILTGDASACTPGQVRASISVMAEDPASNFNYTIYNDLDQVVDMGSTTSPDFLSACLPPGDYRLEVSDNQTCSLDTTFNLFACDLVVFPIESEPVCFGIADGSIILNATSSNGPITYQWSTGDTTDQIINLGSGVFNVAVTDAAGCLVEESFVLPEPQPWNVTYFVDEPSCPAGLGSITANPSGGVEPYFYEWSPDPNGIDTETITDLAPGTYFVTVEDDDGCQIFDTLFLGEPVAPTFEVSNISAPFCEGDNSGQATVTVIPNPTYSGQFGYEASSGATGGGTLSFSITDFNSGDNWVLVTHAISGCVFDTIPIQIPDGQPLQIDLDASTLDNPSCFGDVGVVNLVATGPPGIEFQWPDGTMSNTIVGLPGGVYPIILSAGNCVSVDTLVFIEPEELDISVDQANSSFAACDDATTDIVLQASGGNPGGLQWIWVDDSGALLTQDSFFNDVPVGNYTITATDSRGCIGTLDLTIEPGEGVQFALGEIMQPLCFGDVGIITIDSAFGGAGGYRYQVNTSPAMDISEPFQVPSGDYTVTIFDQNGCSSDTMITINLPDEITADLGPDIEIGLGESTSLNVSVSGNIGINSVFWNPSVDVVCIDSSCATVIVSPVQNQIYTAMVVDNNGCEATDDINVSVVRRETIYIPTAFSPTPSSDARNRTFRVFPGASVQSVDFIRVFDRWGNLVYSEENPVITVAGTGSWDGTHGGQQLDPGVFIYVVQMTLLGSSEPTIRRGDVTLIR